MINNHYLTVHDTRDNRGRILVRVYEWPSDTVTILYEHARESFPTLIPKVGDRLRIAGASVTVVDSDPYCRSLTVTRSRFAQFIIGARNASRLVLLINARIILTLEVWNLATCPAFEVVHWGQVRIIRGVKKLLSRLNNSALIP